jgi:hypothetical protein
VIVLLIVLVIAHPRARREGVDRDQDHEYDQEHDWDIGS